ACPAVSSPLRVAGGRAVFLGPARHLLSSLFEITTLLLTSPLRARLRRRAGRGGSAAEEEARWRRSWPALRVPRWPPLPASSAASRRAAAARPATTSRSRSTTRR